MKRGEVWWGMAAPPVGTRPFVVVSRDILNDVRNSVIVSPVTTRVRGVPTEVVLGAAEGLARACVVNTNTVLTLKQDQLTNRVGSMAPDKVAALDAALRWALDLD